MLDDLVGNKKSGLDDLSYSSDKDGEDYDDNMEEEVHLLENSDVKNVHGGQRQTNFISTLWDECSGEALAKVEYTKKRKRHTDGLQMKWLHDNNVDYKPESFSGCLALVLLPNVGSSTSTGSSGSKSHVPRQGNLAISVAEEVNLRGINFVCSWSDLCNYQCTGPRFSLLVTQSI